jgi:hypothetical protein
MERLYLRMEEEAEEQTAAPSTNKNKQQLPEE